MKNSTLEQQKKGLVVVDEMDGRPQGVNGRRRRALGKTKKVDTKGASDTKHDEIFMNTFEKPNTQVAGLADRVKYASLALKEYNGG